MPDLLLELRSEEIPARMQRKAAGDLRKLVTDGLVEAGLTYEAAREYWTPRRLALDLRGLTARSKDVREEIKGPPVKAPEQAVQGFLRKAGLSSTDQLTVQTDPKKGDFYVAVVERPGRAAEEIIAGLMPGVIRNFPWPKSMRWGRASAPKGTRFYGDEARGGETLRWVRPLQSIVCTFGPETEEPVVVDFSVDGIRSGNVTWGHRFHAPEAITVRRFDDYVSKLEAAKVVLDGERRKSIILEDARNLAFASGLELVEDEGLLEEVSGLVEWPVVLMGEFEEEYLAIPPDVVRLTIRANQKCFVVRPSRPASPEPQAEDHGGGLRHSGPSTHEGADRTPGLPHPEVPAKPASKDALSNRFILTANIEATDGGAEIARGNGKVVRARLSDALYFWKTDQSDLPDLGQLTESEKKFGLDLERPLDQRMARLDHLGVTFHAKLGTQGERVERIARLAEELAPTVGADPALARRAAILAKADLQTEVVGEFPELQGAMGRKYAELQGEDASVAAAIEEHYRPQGPSDTVPTDPVSIAVALADKLDTLVGFWAIDEKPTGSKDPYALRRAALGVIRILVENGVRLGLYRSSLRQALAISILLHARRFLEAGRKIALADDLAMLSDLDALREMAKSRIEEMFDGHEEEVVWKNATSVVSDLLSFFHDRLKVYLRDQGARHDLIDAVLASGGAAVVEGDEPGSRQAPPSALSPASGEISQSQAAAADANDDLLMIVRRVQALAELLDTEDGKNLLAGTKRAVNIIAAEEKKGTEIAPAVDPALLVAPEEQRLFEAIGEAGEEASGAIQAEDFSAAMRAMARLRGPIDTFFDTVLVNDPDEKIRANRLALLTGIRTVTGQVADFSRIAG